MLMTDMEDRSSVTTTLERDLIKFFRAVSKDDLNSVRQFLCNKESIGVINMENEEGKNALEVAMESNNYGKKVILNHRLTKGVVRPPLRFYFLSRIKLQKKLTTCIQVISSSSFAVTLSKKCSGYH